MNEQIELARRYVEMTGVSVFLTGKAGTGKTTFLRNLVEHCTKRHVVLAPTGVAAVNAGGVTIHSFFQLPFEPYLPDVKELITEYQMPNAHKSLSKTKLNIIRTLELLIIDEISMVRADLLDAVDMVLRRYRRNSRPFGGVQLLMIGDVHQLPPVVTERERGYMDRVYPSPFFFNSKALQRIEYVTIELTHVYRQQDASFVSLLNHVRDNNLDAETLAALNARVESGERRAENSSHTVPITLTTHNRQADAINRRHMDALKGEMRMYKALVRGNFPDSMMPIDALLEVREGERVMFVKNDGTGRHRYYNGKLATVLGFVKDEEGRELVEVADDDGAVLQVGLEIWENLKYTLDGKSGQITQEVDGTFSQYPLRPAWAVTIHKAQGLTFDRVAIDAADAFAFGQVYVALSRCRTLEGLTLTTPLSPGVTFGDAAVSQFAADVDERREAVTEGIGQKEKEYRLEKLMELFGIDDVLYDMGRLVERYAKLRNIFPDKVEQMHSVEASLSQLQGVSDRFRTQLMRLGEQEQDQRARQGAEYYRTQLAAARSAVAALTEVEIDNQDTAKAVREASEQLLERLKVKLACMEAVCKEGYSVMAVQRARIEVLLEKEGKGIGRGKERTRRAATATNEVQAQAGSVQEGLVSLLTRWRKEKAMETSRPAYYIFNQKTLMALASIMPRTEAELLAVPGIGKSKVELFGKEILDLVADYREYNGIQ
ncbi:MAG: AAA family ATPase [Bacteroidales bacterium]|nr:AAA family ATPase [Bacteroidales bacterium]